MDGVAGSGLRSHDKYGRLIMHDENGKEFVQLPKTRRPNGTWREGKKVKPDYMPQDEMAAYMSKGTQVRFFSHETSTPLLLQRQNCELATQLHFTCLVLRLETIGPLHCPQE
jgi:hypothetical protein